MVVGDGSARRIMNPLLWRASMQRMLEVSSAVSKVRRTTLERETIRCTLRQSALLALDFVRGFVVGGAVAGVVVAVVAQTRYGGTKNMTHYETGVAMKQATKKQNWIMQTTFETHLVLLKKD